MNELKIKNTLLYSTAQSLKKMNYPDPDRISREICEYCGFDTHEIDKVLDKLRKEQPWDQVRGYTTFCGHKFYVDENVLIPRIETEILVEMLISDQRNSTDSVEFVDVGTGSGCMIISLYLKLKGEDRKFTAIEKYENAIKVAKNNIKLHSAEVKLQKSDLLDKYTPERTEKVVFIANLPYLTENQLKHADRSVSEYEPSTALLGGGDNGSDLILKLLDQTENLTTPHTIYLELDPAQVDKISTDLPERYRIIEVIKDQFDRNRFIHLEST